MKLFVVILFFTSALSAQWIAGVGYQSKSSVPNNGAAFYIVNKLPFQFPAVGFNLKGKINYLFSRETYNIYTTEISNRYQEFSGDVFIESTFFASIFQPFVELGLGGGYITGEAYKKSFFSISGGGGLKLFQGFQPFLELHFRQAFPELNDDTGLDIQSFQIMGIIGILFNF